MNQKYALQFLVLLLMSCSHDRVISVEKKVNDIPQKKISASTKKVARPKVDYRPYIGTIRPGEVYKLKVKGPPTDKGTFTCKNKKIPFFVKNNFLVAYISESYFSDKRPFECYFSLKDSKITVAKFDIEEKKFPFEKLSVDKKKIHYSKKNLKRILREQKELKIIYKRGEEIPFFRTSFRFPLKSKITSIYGTKRLFNNNKKSQHLGTDYRARIGRPIRSSNAGKVVLSKDLFFSGKTVIIDHGLGIFTLYGHLSKIFSKSGEILPKNALLGRAGKTGRVTGPHLHWGVKVHDNWVDGKSLVEQSSK